MTKNGVPTDQWDEIEDEIGEKWKPAPGQQLIGRYVGFNTVTMDGGDEARYYSIRDDGGDLWSITGSVQIRRKFEKVEVGARVRLTYFGERDLGKPGRSPMKEYGVSVAR